MSTIFKKKSTGAMSMESNLTYSGSAISRAQLVAGLYLLGTANGLAGTVVESIASKGLIPAVTTTFDVSITIVVAVMVGVHLARRSPAKRINRVDVCVFAIYIFCLLVPNISASWAAILLLALYETHRNRGSSAAIAASALFIVISAAQFWCGVLLDVFAPYPLEIDAALVALGLSLLKSGAVERIGNLVSNGDNHSIVVMTGCSSLIAISQAFICWLTIVLGFRTTLRLSDVPSAVAVCTVATVINICRMVLMGVSVNIYFLVEGPVGAYASNALIFSIAIAAAIVSAAPWTRYPAARTGS